ncbi:hypothetical protein AAGS40_22790 [Paraburkholderia sp. PREW-6R]|uniref:hypothetical protein n=1 Tax=Paraburkholderia sp. PREW-6R TaxID=3141544 RepID=UPI0031F4988C
MPRVCASDPFVIFERAVINLYDGGVLSPAVLERVIGAFAAAGVDWSTAPREHSVDGRSLHDIVVLTMLPGDALESPSDSFATVVEHIAGASASTGSARTRAKATAADAGSKPPRSQGKTRKQAKAAEADEDEESEELLTQLSGSAQPDKRRRAKKEEPPASGSKGFNPFLNAALPRSRKT